VQRAACRILPICAGGCPLVSSGYSHIRTRTSGQDPTLASRPRPLSTASSRHHRSTTVCRWLLHARSKRDTNAASPICCSALAAVPKSSRVPSRLVSQVAKGLPHGVGHARPFRSRDRCYLTILLTRRLHSSSRDDKIVDDIAEFCGPGEPHRSRSLP
jgi:hypothetical protein